MNGIYWIDGPWQGRLAIAARPRGGDWLRDELHKWAAASVSLVLSLLEPQELSDLDLIFEKDEAESTGLKFVSCPIPDRGVPSSEAQIVRILHQVDEELTAGRNVLVHCRQGIGRSAVIAASLLIAKGVDPEIAIGRISKARG